MVVGLPQGMANQAAVDAAADLAEFLHIELLATFVADATLRALAGLSACANCAALDQGWQAIDVAQITRDIDRATAPHAGVSPKASEAAPSRRVSTSLPARR